MAIAAPETGSITYTDLAMMIGVLVLSVREIMKSVIAYKNKGKAPKAQPVKQDPVLIKILESNGGHLKVIKSVVYETRHQIEYILKKVEVDHERIDELGTHGKLLNLEVSKGMANIDGHLKNIGNKIEKVQEEIVELRVEAK